MDCLAESQQYNPLDVRTTFLKHELEIILRMRRERVPFLAGTDSPTGIDLNRLQLASGAATFGRSRFTPIRGVTDSDNQSGKISR